MQQCPAVSTCLSEMNDAEHDDICAPTFMKSLPMLPHANPLLRHVDALSRTGDVQLPPAAPMGAIKRLGEDLTMAG